MSEHHAALGEGRGRAVEGLARDSGLPLEVKLKRLRVPPGERSPDMRVVLIAAPLPHTLSPRALSQAA
jgi:hypothetical protein